MQKKVLLFFLFFLILPVSAKENRLYFSKIDSKLYYESSLLDKNIFMNHTDMTPGKSYHDRLLIENNTNNDYTLYFKVEVKDQSKQALELLDNIEMKLYIDNKLIYNGLITGINYNGINLQNAIKIGEISKESKVYLDADTKLKEQYDIISNDDLSYVNWNFYAEYDDTVEVIVPKTDIDQARIYKILGIIIFVVAIIVFLIKKKKKTKKLSKIKK